MELLLPSTENNKSIQDNASGAGSVLDPKLDMCLKPTHLGPVDKSAVILWVTRVTLASLKL